MPFSHPDIKQHLADVFLPHSPSKPHETCGLDVHKLQAFNVHVYSNK